MKSIEAVIVVLYKCGAKVKCSGPGDKCDERKPHKGIENDISPECLKAKCASAVIAEVIEVKSVLT